MALWTFELLSLVVNLQGKWQSKAVGFCTQSFLSSDSKRQQIHGHILQGQSGLNVSLHSLAKGYRDWHILNMYT